LNQRRAITLCWTANTPSSAVSMASAFGNGVVAVPSSVEGAANPPTKAMA
jgi:predicted Na+-dependent transporter